MTAIPRTAIAGFVLMLGLLTACGAGNAASPSATPAVTPAAPSSPVVTVVITPVPAPGETFNGEEMTPTQATVIQQEIDEGQQRWRADAKMVAEKFVVAQFAWNKVDCKLSDPRTAECTNPATGKIVVLQLGQPTRQGQGGVWTVLSGVWVK